MPRGDDEGAGAFAQEGIRHRHQGDVGHRRVAEQQVFHFFGSDLFAPAVDQVLVAPFHHQVAVGGEHDPVAGAVETIGREGLGVVLGVTVVTADGVGAAGQQLPHLPHRHRLLMLVHHTNFVRRRQRPALGVQHPLWRVLGVGVADQPLGHAEHLLQAAAEHRFDAPCGLVAEFGAAHLQQLQRRQATPTGLGRFQPDQGQGRHQRGVGHPLALDQFEADFRARRGLSTTRPPTEKVPMNPGQHMGKLCAMGSATRYTLASDRPQRSALARRL